MPNRKQKLFRAANKLAKYYGLSTLRDLAANIALGEVRSPTGQGRVEEDTNNPSENPGNLNSAEAALKVLLIDTSTGAPTTKTILNKIHNEFLRDADRETVIKLGSMVQIHYAGGGESYGGPNNFAVSALEGDETKNGHVSEEQKKITIRDMLNNVEHPDINASPNSPNKLQPGLSIILSNTNRVSPITKFVNPVTIFLNGIPNIEFNRAIPYCNLEFFIDRPPVNAEGGRIQAISIPKFLLGAEQVNGNGVLKGMLESNQVLRLEMTQGQPEQDSQQSIFTMGGIELMTAPQTMVNAEQFEVNNALRANPILDKFRPFLSLQEVNINIVGSTGLMSFKTATVKLVLHDRSRLHEVAEFIRPDFYSRNEITLEYGWSHPDGESVVGDNVYADLINGMRVKEKFMIRNSNFSFEDSGEVVINLDLAMRGATEFDTELIVSNDQSFGNTIRQIRELEEAVAELRDRVFPENSGARQREIRGIQVLNAAMDARNHLTFNRGFKNQLKQLRQSLRSSEGRPEVRQLLNAITNIYGEEIQQRREGQGSARTTFSAGDNSLATAVRRSIASDIENKVTQLNQSFAADPFLLPGSRDASGATRGVEDANARDERRRLIEFRQQQFGVKVDAKNPVSLGKLLLYFIGEPIANTQKYDDIQLIFYPFNIRAGKANRMNIANFLVDLEYFADEFARYRLNHIGRDGTMTLRQFMEFVRDILIDDHAARSYGIGELFEQVVSSDGLSLDTRAKYETPEYMTRLETLLRDVTPDASFVMPVIDFYIETIPEDVTIANPDINADTTNGKSILRIHIFDRASSAYESLGAMLQSTRATQITNLGNSLREAPDVITNGGVDSSHREQWQQAIAAAKEQNLIEYVTSDGTTVDEMGPDITIRFTSGRGESLKQFLMNSMPYIIYGSAGSAINAANLTSMQDSQLSTVNMLRSFRRKGEVLPNGEQPGGLPMQVIPTQLSLETFGCPLINFAQQFFVDFQTGTTADNIYGVAALEHRFSPGVFKSNIKFIALDAFGRYNSLIGRLNSASTILGQIQEESNNSNDASGTGNTTPAADVPNRNNQRGRNRNRN